MTHDDIVALDVGDSIIGLHARWIDEHPIVHVGPIRYREDGRASREIAIDTFGQRVYSTVVAGGREIRGARHGAVSFLKAHTRPAHACSSAT